MKQIIGNMQNLHAATKTQMQNLHAAVVFSIVNGLNSKTKYYLLRNILIHGRIYIYIYIYIYIHNIDQTIITFFEVKHFQFTCFAETQLLDVLTL